MAHLRETAEKALQLQIGNIRPDPKSKQRDKRGRGQHGGDKHGVLEVYSKKGVSIPKRMGPPQDAVEYYTSAKNRGYLADPEEISIECLVLAQKYGYELPRIEDDPSCEMLTALKDARQLFYGLEPGWMINLKDRAIIKPKGFNNEPEK